MTVEFLTLADCRLAYQRQVGDLKRPGLLFLSGFASDMTGTKAEFLAQCCAKQEISYVRFDYRGCGQSEGIFTNGTIGYWLEDTLAVFDQLTHGPQIVIGSSMGGWLGLLLARMRSDRIQAFIGVAAAPDFTEDLIWEKLTKNQREVLLRDREIYEDGAPPDHRVPMTLNLIEEARQHLLLRAPFFISCPIRLLQGKQDREVPWTYAQRIVDHVVQKDVRVVLIENGDHHLSTPADLDILWQMVAEFI